MSEPIIQVENLSKSYVLGHKSDSLRRGDTFRDVVGREARNFARKALAVARGQQIVQGDDLEEFWALKNVSFEVKEGEVIGIIGRNGAGKSTLLKILSRITEPTRGRIELRGRVASLLEVGTGFHPELTGRENIYLNGAILGMTRREIAGKFDEIVAFAEIEKFLDAPVKRYSSGMYVRLAFAVAAHLEPDILIVDEVLAVGDSHFQQKCLGKMDDVSRREGRTVLLVSHNLAAIAEMADRALLLASGAIVVNGSVAEAVSAYLSKGSVGTSYQRQIPLDSDAPHLSRIELLTSDPNGIHRFGEPLEVQFWIQHSRPMLNDCFSFQIFNQFQIPVIHSCYYYGVEFGKGAGTSLVVCRFPHLRLNVGRFHLRTWLQVAAPGGDTYETLDGVCSFEVVRIDQNQLAGWRPEVCAYHEKHDWSTRDAKLLPQMDFSPVRSTGADLASRRVVGQPSPSKIAL